VVAHSHRDLARADHCEVLFKIANAEPWHDFFQRGHADLPKKPLSMYFAFQSKMIKKIKKKHPDAGVPEIARHVKKLYDELPESKKVGAVLEYSAVFARTRASVSYPPPPPRAL